MERDNSEQTRTFSFKNKCVDELTIVGYSRYEYR